ncbi:hypothetical protein DUNSADRAFT_6985 [Dunaliella salina]|uniref:Encoded protein n=1 Tax=Dunaliella salina TaxID=3046 RepID=A0ABQ7GM73_DUNSA|nr:hypothetical protein DUNSADRAFT_6985 [Dunaliella salina]|eukprot:KAF5835706.1 hypothetical protein DUNSADRAFT_6985 [Dunaliella salina]
MLRLSTHTISNRHYATNVRATSMLQLHSLQLPVCLRKRNSEKLHTLTTFLSLMQTRQWFAFSWWLSAVLARFVAGCAKNLLCLSHNPLLTC